MTVRCFSATSVAKTPLRRSTKAGVSMQRKPLLKAFLRYVCENDPAMTSGIPLACRAVTAFSREDPVPKLKPPTTMSPCLVCAAKEGS
jgi:hypothetical protein